MNVSGLGRTVAPAPPRATSASIPRGAASHCAPCRLASRSTASNPTLCRVPAYFRSRFPKPATSFIQDAQPGGGANWFVRVLFVLFLLALLYAFGLRRRARRLGGVVAAFWGPLG